jgi:D-lactate dehydrogenase (cytochrome)
MHEIHTKTCAKVSLDAIQCISGFSEIRKDYAAYLTDESKYPGGKAEKLFFPQDETELAAVFKKMASAGTPVTIAGARTGLVGGCVPLTGALVSLERMNEIQRVYYDECSQEWRVRTQCAVSLGELDRCLLAKRFVWIETHGTKGARAQLARFKKDPGNYFYPPDPTELSASLGGTVATNASGARSYRYGATRNWIRRISVMLPNGEILDIPRGKYFASSSGEFIIYDSAGTPLYLKTPSYRLPATKNTAGIFTGPNMDLLDLFIGSEGIFGAVTEIDVALLKREEKISIIQFVDFDEKALDLVEALRDQKAIALDFLELYSEAAIKLLRQRQKKDPKAVDMPPIPDSVGAALFFEFSFQSDSSSKDYEAIVDVVGRCGVDMENSWAAYEPKELARFKTFRRLLPETVNALIAERKRQHPGLHKLGTDLAVPDIHLRKMWRIYVQRLRAAGMQWVAFGHVGDNHVHINILPRNMDELKQGLSLNHELAHAAIGLGGTVSAEHGIGKIKAPYLTTMYTVEQIQEMKNIKQTLDPLGLLNPGDMFEVGSS